MSLQTDTSLEKIINNDNDIKLIINPYHEESLTPLGYDLRIGNIYSISSKAKIFNLQQGEEFFIKSGATVFVRTLENVEMPSNNVISGLVVSKVSITAQGLINSTTTIDPDWKGQLLLILHNFSRYKIKLIQGQEICTVIFLENSTPSTKPCNKENARNDILIKTWEKLNKKANRKDIIWISIGFFTILLSLIIGYLFFENKPGLVATVTVGISISQFIFNFILRK